MSNKIILGDLERCLFPERYPFFDKFFVEEKKQLQEHDLDPLTFANISFKIRLVKYCFMVQEPNLRSMLNYLFESQVNHFFDWSKEYDWYELKSILLFFSFFSQIKTEAGLFKTFQKRHVKVLFHKYLPKIQQRQMSLFDPV